MSESLSHISVNELSHSFKTEHGNLNAIINININVDHGDFVSVIGPSGCGKTTLLKCIGGLIDPADGYVCINGSPVKESIQEKSMGMVFQDPCLLPWKTVIQNVELLASLNGQDKEDTSSLALSILNTVGLTDFRSYYPFQLSGGMKQRVSLARALCLEPSVLLMDEPLGSLDEITRSTLRYELANIWESTGKTIVLVTHSISEAVLLSDRIIVMSKRPGRIMGELDIDLERPRKEATEESEQFQVYVRMIKELLAAGSSNER